MRLVTDGELVELGHGGHLTVGMGR
jgi:hypothetical protein